MWGAILSAFDPTGPDFATLLVAAFVSLIAVPAMRRFRCISPVMTRAGCIRDFLNASAIVPFILLFFSVGSTAIFDHLKASRLSLGLAGFVGLIFVAGEIYSSIIPESEPVLNPRPRTDYASTDTGNAGDPAATI